MPRNIVVFSDGTGQDGGVRPDQRLSNVYKLFRAARVGPDSSIDPADQIAFYDPGLGTEDDVHGFTRLRRTLQKLAGSITGRGISDNIIDCYEFICNHWRPGDRIFIFGFSRGAYTARCVAQVLALCGIPQHASKDAAGPLQRHSRLMRAIATRAVHEVYEHGAGHPRDEFEAEREEKGRRFRHEFGSGTDDCPNASPYFVGVFDTVAALGAAGAKWWGITALLTIAIAVPLIALSLIVTWLAHLSFWAVFGCAAVVTGASIAIVQRRKALRYIDDYPAAGDRRRSHHIAWHASNYDRGLSGHVGYARQASAIDETRADFPRVPWGRNTVVRPRVGNEPEPLVQLFFAGNHSDIGGSYVETESRLSDVALRWMVDEAASLEDPLLLDRSKLAIWPDELGLQHSEPAAVRDKYLSWIPSFAPAWLRQGWKEQHRVVNGFPVHPSVFSRFAADDVEQVGSYGPYRPPWLRADPRFAPYWGDADTRADVAIQQLAAATIDYVWPPANGSADPDAASILRAAGQTAGAIILPAFSSVDDSEYFDLLASSALSERLGRDGKQWVVVTVTASGTLRRGAFIMGLAEGDARQLARAFGQPVFLVVDGTGNVAAKKTFA